MNMFVKFNSIVAIFALLAAAFAQGAIVLAQDSKPQGRKIDYPESKKVDQVDD
jgi:hypothetical protein